jgi:predicted amidohydrolase
MNHTVYTVEVNRGGFKNRNGWEKILTTEDHTMVVRETAKLLANAAVGKEELEIVVTIEKIVA